MLFQKMSKILKRNDPLNKSNHHKIIYKKQNL